jgi:hypothetical protein
MIINLKELVEEFDELINDPDTTYRKMMNFIKGAGLRLPKSTIPPILEFITVLKHENPMLFYELRDHLPKSLPLHDLFTIDIPYEVAKERLYKG